MNQNKKIEVTSHYIDEKGKYIGRFHGFGINRGFSSVLIEVDDCEPLDEYDEKMKENIGKILNIALTEYISVRFLD